MRLIKTEYTRFKSLQASPDHSFFSVVTNSSIAFWGTDALKETFDGRPDDLMAQMRPTMDVPQSQRLLCSACTIIQADPIYAKKDKKAAKLAKKEKKLKKKAKVAAAKLK